TSGQIPRAGGSVQHQRGAGIVETAGQVDDASIAGVATETCRGESTAQVESGVGHGNRTRIGPRGAQSQRAAAISLEEPAGCVETGHSSTRYSETATGFCLDDTAGGIRPRSAGTWLEIDRAATVGGDCPLIDQSTAADRESSRGTVQTDPRGEGHVSGDQD